MEKQSSKSKSKILMLLLPRAAQASVSFQSPPFSPARNKRADNVTSQKLKSHLYRAFSGPLISMIPSEESKSFETQEPISPKISCMGQIKHKKRISNKPVLHPPTGLKPVLHSWPEPKRKPPPSKIKRILSDRFICGKPPLPDRAPCLSQMMRTGSSRDTCAYLDWTAADGGAEDWGNFYGSGDDAAIETFSAPTTMAPAVLEPRKEINLWKRRRIVQLKPLQLIVNVKY